MESVAAGTASAWCLRFRQQVAGRVRLVCFPHAGGGGAAYHPFSRLLPAGTEVVAIVPPGREARMREAPLTSIVAMAEGAAAAIAALPPLPSFFFGHSMGAMLAFETARVLRRGGHPLPRRLFLSGRRAPGAPPEGETPISGLSADAFVAEMVRRYQGIPAAVLADRELLALLLPIMQADIRAVESYRDTPQAPLPVPVTLMGGRDDPQCTDAAWAGWLPLIAGPVEALRFPGGHFYLAEDRAPVMAALAARL
ncbi:thioesterase II family protein [Methylobacterium aquaticum]|uniref:Thioesterase domain-containing protein n=1 Tax=Methylobacterium aquaticum TaxID=270351 RepID=A0A0J6SB65_9HYPH|nr:alpha/beta fold hydrolase [Methylobacterium aquaticum]KMO30914.1 hypothetical protein VP06_20520 [Methylobacterium aquaticum]